MRTSLLLTAIALGAGVHAGPISPRSNYAVKGSHPVPRGWRRFSKAPAEHMIDLKIGLTQGDFDGLSKHLFEASDPYHAKYGQHLSSEQVNEYIKPAKHASDAVHEWLADHGILAEDLSYSSAKDFINVKLPVKDVETLLDTQYHTYVSEDGRTAVRTPEWSLPEHLHSFIATIQPTNSFFGPRAQARNDKRASKAFAQFDHIAQYEDVTAFDGVCNTTYVTPDCLRELYGVANYTQQSTDKNRVGQNNFLQEVSIRSDAELYLAQFRPEALGAQNNYTFTSINGGTTNQTLTPIDLKNQTGIEGNLDSQTLLGVAWPTPLEIFTTGGVAPSYIPDDATTSDTNEPYLAWLQYVLAMPDPLPSVISTSYDDDEQTVPKDYAIHVCNMLAQLGARGTTVTFAAGDNGVGQAGDCYTNDGTNSSTFLPEFPSTCPYVTSVGGTYQFNPEVPVFDNSSVFGLYTAGGGTSNYFPVPAYQQAAVAEYYSKTNVTAEYAGLFNPSGRAIPDVSAQSLNFSIYWNATLIPVSGTSAATPAFSAIMAIVNDALIAAGKPTLGFINPWLYAGGWRAFNDVTTGQNYGCDTNGFPAVEGYDLATGWGTPNFEQIVALKTSGWGNWESKN